MGFRLIDYSYTMPPLALGQNKLKILLLTVYLTPNIPRDPFRPNKFYLPNQLLRNFVVGQWQGALAKGNLGTSGPETDVDYNRSLHMIDMREKIPLLDLPWGRGKPFTIIDMWEDYDEDLVALFYNEFMVPRFARFGELLFIETNLFPALLFSLKPRWFSLFTFQLSSSLTLFIRSSSFPYLLALDSVHLFLPSLPSTFPLSSLLPSLSLSILFLDSPYIASGFLIIKMN